MSAVFVKLLEMSVVASICILAVAVLRLFLKRLPKIFSYVLWLIVLVRLLCPFAFESSVVGIQTDFYEGISESVQSDMSQEPPVLVSPATGQEMQLADKTDELGTPVREQIDSMRREISARELAMNICMGIWLAGSVGLCFHSSISAWKLKRYLSGAKEVEKGIYEAEELKSPFLFGLLRPCIYLPCGLTETEKSYIIAHETVHKKRLDYLAKPLFYLAVCLHWFNPLVWLAWKLMCKAMEMSCDEAVLGRFGADTRKEYSTVLLTMAVGNHVFSNVPLAFGENDTKARIKNLLSYKKPVVWVLGIVLVLLAVMSAVLLTDRKPSQESVMGERIEFSDWLTCQLPKAQYMKSDGYMAYIGAGGGELFSWTGESSYTTNGSENSAPPEWRAAGGVMLYQQDAFIFENGVLTGVRDISNHTIELIPPEALEGCEEQAIIYQKSHDLYTAPELYMAEEAGTPIPEREQNMDMWYVAMAREDAQHGYLFFLSARYFDKEDVIAFARSVQFKEQAWITAQAEQVPDTSVEDYNREARSLSRNEEMTLERLMELAALDNPTLMDYAGYNGAAWSERTGDPANIREGLTYYIADDAMDMVYRLYINYYIENNALEQISLTKQNSQGGTIVLYDAKDSVLVDTDVLAFLEEEQQMSDWVSYTIPKAEEIAESEYRAGGGYGYGGLYFEWLGENNYTRQEESLNADMWRKAGGVMRYPLTDSWSDYVAAAFENGVFTDFDFHSLNHTSKVGITQQLDNCEEQAVLFKLNHDLFTAADVEEAKAAGNPIPEEEQTSNMWYVAFAREDAPYAYVFYLNERYYDREEVLAFAESVRFTKEAWE